MKRRKFIHSALAFSAFSIAGVSGFQAFQQSQLDYQNQISTQFLSQDDQLVLSVLIPVFCNGMPNSIDINKTIINIDEAISRLPYNTQDELNELFLLLGSAIGRTVLAGVWLNWQKAGKTEVNEFLVSWRSHSLSLLQQAYVGLHQLIIGSVYAEREHWSSIGYPGNPQLGLS